MWRWVLRAAVALGLDKWAKRKAAELIAKAKDKLSKKVEGLEKAHAIASASLGEPPASEVATFRATDGRDYIVRVERRA